MAPPLGVWEPWPHSHRPRASFLTPEMPFVGSSSARGVWPSLYWAQPGICTGRH